MSLSAPGPLSSASPLAWGANPLGGATAFGFEVPQGNPGEIATAARSVRTLGTAMSEQGRALRTAASVAVGADGGWRGSASAAYASYSGHVASVFATGAAGCERAAGVLANLSHELAHAQQVCRQALADCTRYQGEVTTQNQNAATAGARATTLQAGADTALHPAARTQLAHDAAAAGRAQQAAQTAAHTADGELNAARQRGITAYETYLRIAQRAGSELEAAAGDMRTAPSLPGGAPIPVTTSASDISVANAMIAAAGGLPAAANALNDPAELRNLAGGQLTPGVFVQYLDQVDQRERSAEQQAQIAAEKKKSGGGLLNDLENLPVSAVKWLWHQDTQIVSGAWSNVQGTASMIIHPGRVVAMFNALLSTNPAYRELVDHENPVTAQANASQTSAAITRSIIDWNDISHGRIARAAGAIGVGFIGAKGLGEVGGVADASANAMADGARGVGGLLRSPEARPTLTTYAGKAVALKVPHADEAAQALAPATRYSITESRAALRAAPSQLVHTVLGTDEFKISPQLAHVMAQTPAEPRVIVASHPPEVVLRRPPPVVSHVRPRGFPRGR